MSTSTSMTSLAQAFGSANPVGGSADLPGYMDTSDCWSNDLEEDPNIPFPAWVLQRRMRNNIVDRDTISQMSMDSTDSRWVYQGPGTMKKIMVMHALFLYKPQKS